jgi:hypothetical protein
VEAHGLDELGTDGEGGVKGGGRVLEDHADAAAAQVCGVGEEILAFEGEAIGGDAGIGAGEPKEGEEGGGLARAAFADEAEDGGGGDVDAEAVERMEPAGRCLEGDGEVLDVEAGACCVTLTPVLSPREREKGGFKHGGGLGVREGLRRRG